ncbi:MAG: GDYXXLXY domain-containing protein [Myxococcales bacterium]|jgi:uncharacterized membrane-anchored protein
MTTRRTLALFAIVCLAQLALAASGIARHELVLVRGTAYRFETAPVDPVDLFRGRYVRLDFRAARVDLPLPEGHAGMVYAVLGVDDRGFAHVTELRTTPPERGDYLHVRAWTAPRPLAPTRTPGQPPLPTADAPNAPVELQTRLELPFTRFYMEESAAPEAERRYREQSTDPDAPPAYAVVYVHDGEAVMQSLELDGPH